MEADVLTTADSELQPVTGNCRKNLRALAQSEPRAVANALDYLDKLSVNALLPEVLERSLPSIQDTATALATEGGRGATARRLLARDVAIGQIRLRYYQALLSHDIDRFCKVGLNERRVRLLERIVGAEHQRLMTSLEHLTRLDSPVPAIRVHADQAAFLVGSQQ